MSEGPTVRRDESLGDNKKGTVGIKLPTDLLKMIQMLPADQGQVMIEDICTVITVCASITFKQAAHSLQTGEEPFKEIIKLLNDLASKQSKRASSTPRLSANTKRQPVH